MLKHDMELLTYWFRANQLSLNMAKTILMTFWNTPDMNIIVDNTPIPQVDQTKFLGVILDSQLSWRNHTNTLYNKLITNKFLLTKSKRFISAEGLISIYYGHIHSHINYELINWGSMVEKCQIRKLRTAQNACVRLLTNKLNRKPINDIYKENKILTLDQMIQLEHCKYGHYITHQKLPKPIQDILNANGGQKEHTYMQHDTKQHPIYKSMQDRNSTKATCVKA